MSRDKENIIAALINLGCLRKYYGDNCNWSYRGYPFKIREKDTLTDVFKTLMSAAEGIKIWQIKEVLNIID